MDITMANDFITCTVDISQIKEYLHNIQQDKQIPYTVGRAINNIALSVQNAIRTNMKQHIYMNREAFNLNSIKITSFANKVNPSAIISIDSRAYNLTRLTTGEQHLPINGRSYLAIPNREVFKGKVIMPTNKLYIKNLRLHAASNGAVVGEEGTYLSPTKPPMILQDIKIGRGKNKKDKKRILYTLVKKSKGVIKLDFYGIAQRIINGSLDNEIQSAIATALRTARK